MNFESQKPYQQWIQRYIHISINIDQNFFYGLKVHLSGRQSSVSAN